MPRTLATFNPLSEIVGMAHHDLTDSVLLGLHIRQLTSAGQSENSLRAREGAVLRLRRYLDPDSENPRILCEATAHDLVTWQGSIAHLAPASVNKYVMHCQLFYSWLVKPMRVIDESPAEDLVKPIVKQLTPRPISEENLQFALDTCSDRLVFTWMILGAYAGLRAVDCAALHADDLILTGDVPLLRVRGKGGHEKLVAVGLKVVDVLAPYAAGRGPMFVDPNGKRCTAKKIDRRVNAHLAGMGLPERFHCLRHRYGTRMYAITKDLIHTQHQMRHATVTSTTIYTLVDRNKHPDALKQLDGEISERVKTRERRRP